MNRSRWRLLSLVLILLVLSGGGALWYQLRADPLDAQRRQLEQDAKAALQLSMSPEDRIEQFRLLAEKSANLPPEQRKKMGQSMQQFFASEVQRYFTLPPDERTKMLDQAIDLMETMRLAQKVGGFFSRMGRSGNRASATAPGSQPPAAATTPSASPPLGPPGGPPSDPNQPRKRWEDMTPDERETMRRQFVDRFKPEDRARFSAFMKDLAARRKQRGLPDIPFGPPPGPPPAPR